MFYSGHPDIEKIRGSMHVFRTDETFLIDDIDTKMSILAIHATIFLYCFYTFYIAFVLLFTEGKCRAFYKELNGRPSQCSK